MKKLTALLLAVVMVLSLAACGDNSGTTTAPAAPATTKAPEAGTTKAPEAATTEAPQTNPKMDPSLYGGELILRFAYTSNSIDVQHGWGLFANRQWTKCIYETALGEGGRYYVPPDL